VTTTHINAFQRNYKWFVVYIPLVWILID